MRRKPNNTEAVVPRFSTLYLSRGAVLWNFASNYFNELPKQRDWIHHVVN